MKHVLFNTMMVAMLMALSVKVATAQQPHVYINPGHGGYDSDDRNMVIYPFSMGDSAGSWESKSNLRKGLALKEILEKKGYKTSISRVTNTTADDLPLSTIVALCNQSGADVFYSIHSNATGTSAVTNFPMVFYRGYTGSPQIADADVLAADLEPCLYANTSTVWTHNYQIWGDWSFRPEWGTQGYGVLRGNRAVANLSEGSFHDYIPEAYRLLSPYYCWMEGWNISLGADKYFGRLDDYGLGVVSGNVRDDRIHRLQENPQPFIVYGDDALMPIHGATVRLLDGAGNEVQRCVTDTLRNGIYVFKYVTPGNYTVEVSEPSHFSQTAGVTVEANKSTYQNFYLKRVRDTPPVVVDYSPVWHEGDAAIKCSHPIELTFNWDMDSATTCSAFRLDPPVEGSCKWEDSYHKLVFTPDDAFDVNTLYTLTLDKSAQHGGGTAMVEDFTMQFFTQPRNHLEVLAVFPYEGAQVHYKTPTVELRVDSLLDTYNLFNKMRVIDGNGDEVAWNKRNIKYNKRGDNYGFVSIQLSRDLLPGEDYKLILDMDIADTVGIHLPAQRVIHFTAVDAGTAKPGMTVVEEFDKDEYCLGWGNSNERPFPTFSESYVTGLFNKSLSTEYDYGGSSLIFLHYGPDWGLEKESWEQPFHRGDKVGIHLWGDMPCSEVSIKFRSYDSGWISIPLCTMDFHGWRYVEMVLNELNPDDDYYLYSIDFHRGNSKMGQSGTIKMDNLIRGESSAVNEVALANMQLRVAGDYIVVGADTWVQGVELIDIQGRSIKAAGGNCLNVADVEPGIYIVRVHINGMMSTRKVVIN